MFPKKLIQEAITRVGQEKTKFFQLLLTLVNVSLARSYCTIEFIFYIYPKTRTPVAIEQTVVYIGSVSTTTLDEWFVLICTKKEYCGLYLHTSVKAKETCEALLHMVAPVFSEEQASDIWIEGSTEAYMTFAVVNTGTLWTTASLRDWHNKTRARYNIDNLTDDIMAVLISCAANTRIGDSIRCEIMECLTGIEYRDAGNMRIVDAGNTAWVMDLDRSVHLQPCNLAFLKESTNKVTNVPVDLQQLLFGGQGDIELEVVHVLDPSAVGFTLKWNVGNLLFCYLYLQSKAHFANDVWLQFVLGICCPQWRIEMTDSVITLHDVSRKHVIQTTVSSLVQLGTMRRLCIRSILHATYIPRAIDAFNESLLVQTRGQISSAFLTVLSNKLRRNTMSWDIIRKLRYGNLMSHFAFNKYRNTVVGSCLNMTMSAICIVAEMIKFDRPCMYDILRPFLDPDDLNEMTERHVPMTKSIETPLAYFWMEMLPEELKSIVLTQRNELVLKERCWKGWQTFQVGYYNCDIVALVATYTTSQPKKVYTNLNLRDRQSEAMVRVCKIVRKKYAAAIEATGIFETLTTGMLTQYNIYNVTADKQEFVAMNAEAMMRAGLLICAYASLCSMEKSLLQIFVQ